MESIKLSSEDNAMIQANTPPQLTLSLVNQYKNKKFVLIKDFISKNAIEYWSKETENLPARRVSCNNPSVTWDEQNLSHEHSIYQFFSSHIMRNLMLNLEASSPSTKVGKIVSWTCRYKQGEFIERHKDKSGTIQAIICLKTVDQKNGGTLILDSNMPIHLMPGDLLILKASSLYHQTTPLINTPDCLDPMRTIAVARYFFT